MKEKSFNGNRCKHVNLQICKRGQRTPENKLRNSLSQRQEKPLSNHESWKFCHLHRGRASQKWREGMWHVGFVVSSFCRKSYLIKAISCNLVFIFLFYFPALPLLYLFFQPLIFSFHAFYAFLSIFCPARAPLSPAYHIIFFFD